MASDLTSTTVTLTWDASTDSVGVVGYEVRRATNGGPPSTVATVAGTTYQVTDLAAETEYTFTVRARDAAGNVSAASPARTVTTPPGGGGGGSGCTATYKLINTWAGGFQGEVTVENTGTVAIAGWQVAWTDPGGTAITSLWNGRWTFTGGENVVLHEAYNGQLAAGSSTTFGFTGTGPGTAPAGQTCSAR